MTTAVLGATGTIGPSIIAALQARDADIRVLARDPARAAQVLGKGITVRPVDLASETAILPAVEGATSLLLLTSHGARLPDIELRVIRALRKLPLRIVKISATSTAIRPDGPPVGRHHWEVETVLRGSGQPFVILRPNAFMQTFLLRELLPGLRASGRVVNAIAGAGISMIDARDIGDCAAVALTTASFDGETIALTGGEAVTYARMAAILEGLCGHPVPVEDVTPAEMRDRLVERGMPPWEAQHFEGIYSMFRRRESEHLSDGVARMTGKPPRTVDAFLSEHSSALSIPEL